MTKAQSRRINNWVQAEKRAARNDLVNTDEAVRKYIKRKLKAAPLPYLITPAQIERLTALGSKVFPRTRREAQKVIVLIERGNKLSRRLGDG